MMKVGSWSPTISRKQDPPASGVIDPPAWTSVQSADMSVFAWFFSEFIAAREGVSVGMIVSFICETQFISQFVCGLPETANAPTHANRLGGGTCTQPLSVAAGRSPNIWFSPTPASYGSSHTTSAVPL
jgi:hypothetical protein